MKILGINHIGIAAKDPIQFKKFFATVCELADLGSELVKSQKTLTTMLASAHADAVFSTRIELLEPEVNTHDGPISKYLEKKGGGIHHIALCVDDVTAAISHLMSKGVRMIDEKPRDGAHHTKIAFVHPEATGGVLVEFVQEAK
jgi:methylmalonyl-CoA/ethylmalonyl-CoA epimerase